MKQNPRRRHIKNQGDLNLAVQTKSIGNWVYSIFNEQKQENLFLDNLVKTVPIPCIFFFLQHLDFSSVFRITEKTLCWGVSSWLSDSCKVPGILHGSTTRYFLTCLSRTPQSSVRRSPTRRLMCCFYVLYGFLQIFKWFEIYLCLSQYYAHLCVASRCVLAICYLRFSKLLSLDLDCSSCIKSIR